MSINRELQFGPGDIMLDGTQLPQRDTAPIFGLCLLWPNGWMDQDTIWYGVCLGLGRHIVLGGDPVPPERGTAAPSFRPMSIVEKPSPISATAEHL